MTCCKNKHDEIYIAPYISSRFSLNVSYMNTRSNMNEKKTTRRIEAKMLLFSSKREKSKKKKRVKIAEAHPNIAFNAI